MSILILLAALVIAYLFLIAPRMTGKPDRKSVV